MLDYFGTKTAIACGSCSYTVVLVGLFGFLAVGLFLFALSNKSNKEFDGLLLITIPSNHNDRYEIEQVLSMYCDEYSLITLRKTNHGKNLDYAYQFKIKKNLTSSGFLEAFKKFQKIVNIKIVTQDFSAAL